MKKKMISAILVCILALAMVAPLTAYAAWEKQANGTWKYKDDNTGYYLTGWAEGNSGNVYYFDASGTMQTGWQKIDGIWYYFDEWYGYMYYSSTYDDGGQIYAFDQNGALLYGNGWKKLIGWDGTVLWVFLKNNLAQTGWLDGGGGKWYYLYPTSGYMIDDGCKTGDYLSLFNSNGVWKGYYKTPGWIHVGDDWYYINSDGTIKTGWLTLSGKKYYLDPDYGYMLANGYYTIGGTEYEFDESGALVQ